MTGDGATTIDELVAGSSEDIQRHAVAVGAERATRDGRAWTASDDPAVREVGFIVLGLVALDDPHALAALLEHAGRGCQDADAEVRDALAGALGQQSGEQRCVPFLLRLVDDPDIAVRQSAISGLAVALDDPAADHPAVAALVRLLADPEVVVRDWAAFALGTQLEVDSPEIREGLRGLLGEPETDDAYPAAEAALGLARRADPGIVATVADRLGRPAVRSLWLEAAGELADPRLLPALLALRAPDTEPDDPWVRELERAIVRCDPDQVMCMPPLVS